MEQPNSSWDTQIGIQSAKIAARSIFASFPGLASVATWWSENESFAKEKRLEELFASIRRILENHADRLKKVEDFNAASREEFGSLFERTIERALAQYEIEKIGLLAAIFVGTQLSDEDLEYYEKTCVLDTVSELTVGDISVLRCFDRADRLNAGAFLPDNTGLDSVQMEAIISRNHVSLRRLEARGVVTQAGGSLYADVMKVTKQLGDWAKHISAETYHLTPFGRKVIRLLSTDEPKPSHP